MQIGGGGSTPPPGAADGQPGRRGALQAPHRASAAADAPSGPGPCPDPRGTFDRTVKLPLVALDDEAWRGLRRLASQCAAYGNALLSASYVEAKGDSAATAGLQRAAYTDARETLSAAILLADLGAACAEYQDRTLRNLPCKRIQCDEIWAFCYAKAKNVPEAMRGMEGVGDVWTWTALCADGTLVPSWLVGDRDAGVAAAFMDDLAGRLATRVQLTTDGHKVYLNAVAGAFAWQVDYARLVKLYGAAPEAEVRYSPAQCIGARVEYISGDPDPAHVSTSFVERQNLRKLAERGVRANQATISSEFARRFKRGTLLRPKYGWFALPRRESAPREPLELKSSAEKTTHSTFAALSGSK